MNYDNHVRVVDIKLARDLGFSGMVLIQKWKTGLKLENKKNIISGVELSGTDDIRKISHKMRKKVDIIAVRGGDLEVNRSALENPLIDILIQPWGDPITGLRNDPGVDHVTVKIAKKNNVHIDFSFTDLIKSHKRTRIKLFSNMLKTAKLIKKYKAPFIISSGALSRWDMRSVSDLKSFGRLLGFEDTQIRKAISDDMVKENKKRRSSKWIQPGVEIA